MEGGASGYAQAFVCCRVAGGGHTLGGEGDVENPPGIGRSTDVKVR